MQCANLRVLLECLLRSRAQVCDSSLPRNEFRNVRIVLADQHGWMTLCWQKREGFRGALSLYMKMFGRAEKSGKAVGHLEGRSKYGRCQPLV